MISSPHRRSRSGLWFAAFTIISLLLLLASQTDPAQTLQSISARRWIPSGRRSEASGRGSPASSAPLARSTGCAARTTSCGGLASAEQRIAELQEAAVENAELRDLLGLTQSLDMDLLPVRIISRDPSNFTWEIGIDAGTDQGLAVGMPVVGLGRGGGSAGRQHRFGRQRHGHRAAHRRYPLERGGARSADSGTGPGAGPAGWSAVMVQVDVTDDLAETRW